MCVNRNSKAKPIAASAGLLAAVLTSAAAQAAVPPTITISGVVGSSTQNLDGYVGTVAFDTSAWFGKGYTLELTPDVAGVNKVIEEVDEIPGETVNVWSPLSVGYRLTIDGNLVFAGGDNQFSELVSANNILVPSGTDLTDFPAGIIADGTHTYDDYALLASGIDLGCFDGGVNGVCDAPGDTFEYGTIDFGYLWDVADRQGIADENYPDPQSIVFEDGVGMVHFTIGHFSQVAGGADRVLLPFSVASVTVTPVPEPETWAMLLVGLGLVGFATAKRRV